MGKILKKFLNTIDQDLFHLIMINVMLQSEDSTNIRADVTLASLAKEIQDQSTLGESDMI